jgi:hypothetical protein
MHIVDTLPVLFVAGVFLYVSWKIATEFLSARRAH